MQNPLEKWEEIYEAGEQLNRAPFDEVVSFVFRHAPEKPRHETKILEVGCGAGNNLKFLACEGFYCSGIDGSETAVRQACVGMIMRQNYCVRQGDFRYLPYENDSMDLVIDRASLWYVDVDDAIATIKEIHRVLVPGGKFLFTPCHSNADDRTGPLRRDTVDEALMFFGPEWKVLSAESVLVRDELKHKAVKSWHSRIVAEKRP